METLWNNWHTWMWSTGVLTAIAARLVAHWIRLELLFSISTSEFNEMNYSVSPMGVRPSCCYL
jgi:hypothetical protein